LTEADLEKVYTEMKRVRVELKSIERTLESLAESLIPKEKASPEEIKELESLRREAECGNSIPLEEVLKKHGVKKLA
jgi:hypothetical protein